MREIAAGLEDLPQVQQFLVVLIDAAESAKCVQEGPLLPNKFAFAGKKKVVNGPQVFRLISALWKAQNRLLHLDELNEPVLLDLEERLTKNQIHSIKRDANRFFRKHKIPYHITKTVDCLELKEGLPRAAKKTPRNRERN